VQRNLPAVQIDGLKPVRDYLSRQTPHFVRRTVSPRQSLMRFY